MSMNKTKVNMAHPFFMSTLLTYMSSFPPFLKACKEAFFLSIHLDSSPAPCVQLACTLHATLKPA